ncbi:PML-RARA-regulated adapter molecule 1 isoform X2 [Pongo abelii]|uniref:PML-RARA-regulated adapter molecule 1 isoform X2 n=2 Tax=Pongo abelii TaxID=9601 RepID=UPI003006E810
MESHQDFQSIKAKFQASQLEPSDLPKKPPKPEFSKLKKFSQPELSEHPKKAPLPEFGAVSLKPPQPQFTDLPKKPPPPEFTDLPKKPLLPQFTDLPKKPPPPEVTDLPKKPPPPEVTDLPKKPPPPEVTDLPKKPPPPEVTDLPKKPPPPEVTDLPKKPSKLEFSDLSKKFPQLEATPFPRKPLQPEVGEAPLKASLPEEPGAPARKPLQPDELSHPARPRSEPKSGAFPRKLWQPEASEATPKSPQPELSTFPKKPAQPEFNVYPKKSPQPQVGGLPKKSVPQPEFSEAAQTPLWKPQSSEPKHDSSAFPKKASQPPLSDFPKKPPQPELGDLTRTSSEPEVSVLPKRPRPAEFKALSKKPPQPELGGLPRTSSEPEFNSLPRKLLQPERRGPPRKFSQPEPNAVLKRHPQPEFFGDLPRKPPLPSSASESSLPAAVAGSSSRHPLSPGFGVTGTPRWRSGGLVHSGGARPGLRPSHPPRRRPLPPASSLGPPPAKPPLPPGPVDMQSFRRPSAASIDLRRTRSAAGLHFQDRQPEDIPQVPDEIYELYDDVEPREDSSPSPKGRDEAPSVQQAARRPPQDPALRKEKDPQPQQLPPMDPKLLKQLRKAEKAEREFRKKFKFEGEIVVHTKMMIDPNAKTRRGGGKHLGIRRGEILEVIEFTSNEEMLCRDPKGKCECARPRSPGRPPPPPWASEPTIPTLSADGYVPRTALLPLETEVYDDVDFCDPLENQPLPLGR